MDYQKTDCCFCVIFRFLTKKSQVVPFAFLAKIRLFHNSVHFFIAVVDNFCYTERQNQNEMCLRGRQLS